MDLREKVGAFITDNRLLKSSDRVIVGVSGGADSVALLRVLVELGFDCIVVHCNFHLRGEESDRDRRFVENLCSRMGVEVIVCEYDTRAYAAWHRCSIEMAARELRYSDFERLRRENGCAAVAVAHHRDDSVETVLMNLIRGTGIRGLTGIRPRNGNVIRPMLCLTRADIVGWLKSENQQFVTDSTNMECEYSRNRIRLQLLEMMSQMNPDVSNAISRTSERLVQVYDIYKDAISKSVRQCVSVREDGIIEIAIERVKGFTAPEALLFEILSPHGFNETQIHDVISVMDGEPGRSFTSAGATLVKDRGVLLLKTGNDSDEESELYLRLDDGASLVLHDGRRLSVEILPEKAAVIRDSMVATLDADRLSDTLTLRRWRSGDSFVPFGMKGRKLLSDYMTDCKMDLLRKREQLVLCDSGNIVWVVGERIDNRYRIGDDTTRTIRIYLSKD